MKEQQPQTRFSEFAATGESGFSMIELLIAIVVITFGLVSIVGISAYVSRANSISATLNVLASAAQDQVDRLRTARWSRTFTDPMLTVGGSVPYVSSTSTAESRILNPTQVQRAWLFAVPIPTAAAPAPTPTPTPVGGTYTYTLDPNNPHHATAAGTPVGDLVINWEVRQGGTPDVRIVTINVVQENAPPNLANGFTVTTAIVRN
jgi:prepilin-type N-terminal cleavage/methylation domain-containing protein